MVTLDATLTRLPEAELRERMDPGHLNRLRIYPGGWSTADAEWLVDVFGAMRRFVHGAAELDLALVVFLG